MGRRTNKSTAYIGLGSNLGNRRDYVERALRMLRDTPGIVVSKVSSFYETVPVGGPPGQPNYVNAAAELETDREAQELMGILLTVEKALGRLRTEKNGPRTIDLDLLLFDDMVRDGPDLILPHPRLHERFFALKPLAEIAPQTRHPVLGASIADLLQECVERGAWGVERESMVRASHGTLPELAGLRSLVTGSTSGIGQAIARELASAGAKTIIHGRRVSESTAGSSENRVLSADLSRPDECARLAREAWAVWDGLDIWVNNAGADTLTGAAAQWPFERKLQQLLQVDLTATMLLSRDIGGRMKARGGGIIINIGWDQAETGMEGDSGQLFAATKGAVMAFSKSLALHLAPEVRVNCVAPGWIKTAWGDTASHLWQERVLRETPLGRWGTPEDVAATVRWLVSPAAGFVTGQIIRVNGGVVR
jgi:2-amino-4-hydroxy-6-hydroxymethyldihydropteridine diphosphokinase